MPPHCTALVVRSQAGLFKKLIWDWLNLFNSTPSPCVPLVDISLGISFFLEPVQHSSWSGRSPRTWWNQILSKYDHQNMIHHELIGRNWDLNPCRLDGQGRQWPNFQMIPQL